MHFQGKGRLFGVSTSLLMSTHDHYAWDIGIRIVLKNEFDKQPVLEPRYRDDDPKPEVAHPSRTGRVEERRRCRCACWPALLPVPK